MTVVVFILIGAAVGISARFPVFAILSLFIAAGYWVFGPETLASATERWIYDFGVPLAAMQVGYFATIAGRIVVQFRRPRESNPRRPEDSDMRR
jgi:hypothetical protein